jgi:hypothetical protein
MASQERPEPAQGRDVRPDIRHLVCGESGRYPSYQKARIRVIEETAAGGYSRIVLVTNRSHAAAEMALDVPLDILPVFDDGVPGGPCRIDRAILDCLFSSARRNTVFLIYETGHPILGALKKAMRKRGIAFGHSRACP